MSLFVQVRTNLHSWTSYGTKTTTMMMAMKESDLRLNQRRASERPERIWRTQISRSRRGSTSRRLRAQIHEVLRLLLPVAVSCLFALQVPAEETRQTSVQRHQELPDPQGPGPAGLSDPGALHPRYASVPLSWTGQIKNCVRSDKFRCVVHLNSNM